MLKLLKSRLVKEEQWENILLILSTFSVLKLLKSRLVKDSQELNISRVDNTFSVLTVIESEKVVKILCGAYCTVIPGFAAAIAARFASATSA